MKTQQSTTAPKAAQPEIHGARNIAGIVHELWERTADRLTPSELEWFAGAAESAVLTMQNLEDVIEGIGCLVGGDEGEKGHAPTGSFQNTRDASALLFFLAESVRHVRALVTVSDAASYRLRNPDLYRQTDPYKPPPHGQGAGWQNGGDMQPVCPSLCPCEECEE